MKEYPVCKYRNVSERDMDLLFMEAFATDPSFLSLFLDKLGLTEKMYRILAPGGSLFLNDMDCAYPIRALANWLFPRLPGGDVKMYTRREITEMIQSAGFERWYYRKISPFSFLCIARKA